MGQVKNNEVTQKYCIQALYSAVMAYVSEIYDFGPFCNTSASLFLTWPLDAFYLDSHSVLASSVDLWQKSSVNNCLGSYE